MAEDNTNTMNLDLNLGPLDNSSDDNNDHASASYPNVTMNLEDWLDGPVHRVREVVRQRNQRWRSLWRQVPIPQETRNLALELIMGNSPQTGEASAVIPDDNNPTEPVKTCENQNIHDENEKNENGIDNDDESSFFDCNICLDLSKDPVVTCCGHLFCWPCLYRWLHHHSDAKECPVCKGEVTSKNVTPIYGRGSNNNSTRDPDLDSSSSLKIPLRPQGRRVESWRQTIHRTAFTIPMEEMIRRLGNTFDLSRELAQVVQNADGTHESSPERSNNSSLLRLLSSRAMRREQRERGVPSDHVIDLTEGESARDSRRISSLLLSRRSNSIQPGAALSSAMSSAESLAAERLVESYFHSNPVLERRNSNNNQELVRNNVDDRDSVSSIAAVIHSESQTVDNAVEIDSRVSVSTSSSRRRNEASRISDVDSGDSRAPRRRRLN